MEGGVQIVAEGIDHIAAVLAVHDGMFFVRVEAGLVRIVLNVDTGVFIRRIQARAGGGCAGSGQLTIEYKRLVAGGQIQNQTALVGIEREVGRDIKDIQFRYDVVHGGLPLIRAECGGPDADLVNPSIENVRHRVVSNKAVCSDHGLRNLHTG